MGKKKVTFELGLEIGSSISGELIMTRMKLTTQ